MNLLILGGTRFLGYHLVAAARDRGHDVTLFHRGTGDQGGRASHPHLPGIVPGSRHEPWRRAECPPLAGETPALQAIHGDRNRDLAKLHGRQWDAVIDTCGYLPQSVRASAEALAPAVELYVFISSVSAYADLSVEGIDESAPLHRLTAEELQHASTIDASGAVSATTYGSLYGGLKALCEEAAEEVLPGRVLTIRAGLIAGPRDYTDRFTSWAVRIARGGEVLAPGRPHQHVQFIDARDLAEWIVAMAERRQPGVFNASGPRITMTSLLETCRAVSESGAELTWVSEAFLLAEGVRPWTEMPLWLPEDHMRGLMAIDCDQAMAAGLRHRPLHDTVRDVLRWYAAEEAGRPLRSGLTADRERELLRKWYGTHAENQWSSL